jgi:hypothetical protein
LTRGAGRRYRLAPPDVRQESTGARNAPRENGTTWNGAERFYVAISTTGDRPFHPFGSARDVFRALVVFAASFARGIDDESAASDTSIKLSFLMLAPRPPR